MQVTTDSTIPYERSSRTKRGRSVKIFLFAWILLIALGIAAAYKYSNELKQDLLQQLQHDNQQQMTLLKSDYEQKFTELSSQVAELNSKVQSFNELLTFTKDNATNKTDNSNQLYTQLNEVKQQLTNLQKKMDLLK
ncbi:hypothetical protein [Paenibacillus crassostreae]|uniref:Uncharacterized protein n=1 Tax=Paenibacillus crassostreae TaxID=1763538 RepID=A0A167GUM5_9BACL|nr:hypothetical protein [Paenibacillus crassostreae]AOZ94611.1 hypothetical protein LPB68_07345 [Paenibacillus crassostreae]OAB77925.1 hypothetical protein PNBC_00425 [Paenibacillus crassostreae]